MGFFKTLAALFVHDALTQKPEKETKTRSSLVDEQVADEQSAYNAFFSRYYDSEQKISKDFLALLDATEKSVSGIHDRAVQCSKALDAMPIMIALEHKGELFGALTEGEMYHGVQKIFDEKEPNTHAYAGWQLKKAHEEYSDLYIQLCEQVGVTELGTIWYDMLYLVPKDPSFSVQNAVLAIFNDICDCADAIARMCGNDYKYSSIPDTIASLSIEFETLLEFSNSDTFKNYNPYDEYLEAVDYLALQVQVKQVATPKIVAMLQSKRR